MPPSAAAPLLAPKPAPPPPDAEQAPGGAGERPMCLIVGPGAESASEIRSALAEASPGCAVVACSDGARALDKAETGRRFGWSPALYVFDYRGVRAGDLADQLRRVRADDPAAELVVLLADGEADLWRAALKVCQPSDKLTFLATPFWRADAAGTLAALIKRHGLAAERTQTRASGEQAIRDLELNVKALRDQLELATHQARHDPLTGVLNRAGFVAELTARLERSGRRQTVLLIDLDRFKLVNDTLGHHAGDDLVRKVCASMASLAPAGGLIARLGGDEFGIIVDGMSDVGVDELCTRLLRACAQSRRVLGHEVQISASIGVAVPDETRSEVSLMRRADVALYAAKREGRNRFRRFDAALERESRRRLSIESGLEIALRTGQFRMVYQPIVKAAGGEVAGFEALVRWDSPEHGQVSPAEFVPVAEETGLILDLGDWITRQAFRDCRRWAGHYVSVNLSARQFLRPNVAGRILRYAGEADLAPERIQLELTETAIIDDVERAARTLDTLRKAGMRVALDDFGVGYSSLTYLNQFGIDCIKIDKSFVDNVATDRQSAIIVASLARLAAHLGMSVVAEGVETDAQRDVLTAAGCGALQGFRFGRPMGPVEARALSQSRAAGT